MLKRRTFLAVFCLVVSSVVALWVGFGPASAATFTVTKTADTNDGSCSAGFCRCVKRSLQPMLPAGPIRSIFLRGPIPLPSLEEVKTLLRRATWTSPMATSRLARCQDLIRRLSMAEELTGLWDSLDLLRMLRSMTSRCGTGICQPGNTAGPF